MLLHIFQGKWIYIITECTDQCTGKFELGPNWELSMDHLSESVISYYWYYYYVLFLLSQRRGMRGDYEKIRVPQDTAVKIKKMIKVCNFKSELIH
jgi:hypothetical protein